MSESDPNAAMKLQENAAASYVREDHEAKVSKVELTARSKQLGIRLQIARAIWYAFIPLIALTVLCVVFLWYVIFEGQKSPNPTAAMAFASSVQVIFGMATGYVCIFIGLMMTWFGIEAAYSFDGSAEVGEGKGNVALKSASPGLFFALGGMILVAVSLYKPITYRETGTYPGAFLDLGSGEKKDKSVTPQTPVVPTEDSKPIKK